MTKKVEKKSNPRYFLFHCLLILVIQTCNMDFVYVLLRLSVNVFFLLEGWSVEIYQKRAIIDSSAR